MSFCKVSHKDTVQSASADKSVFESEPQQSKAANKSCSSPTWHAHLCQDNTVSDRFRMFWWYHDISIYHISLITNISYRYLIGSTLIVYIQCISCKKKIRPGLPKKLTLPKMKIQHFDTLILSPNLRPHMISVEASDFWESVNVVT